MNKDCYRVIFSKVRGMMVVVSELTKSQGKKSSADTQFKSFSKPLTSPKTSLKRLTVALLCCQSMVYTQALAATTQIQNTASNIPSSQRAALLKAPNGTPIVNIRTPNSKGLSHNTYNQFDIGSNGAVLNNSTHDAKTQLAGTISGNQYLGKGAANTILNEIRSNKTSQLNGTIEVAGQQADIIIANPSGLQIQGGGFINVNRATLTTGTPKIDTSGNLTGLDVKQGQVQFNNAQAGFALGGSAQKQANYVDVLARAINVNGKIQASESVTMISGSNSVDYDTLAATEISGTGTKPTLAVDVSNLGGVYANSIQLIGTEAGLGVKNAGVIQAGQQIRLTNTGKIENSGTIATTKKQTSLIDLEAAGSTGSINHTGSLNSYGMINLQADKDITLNAGAIKKNNVSEDSNLLPNTINLAAKQDITIENKASIQNGSPSTNSNIYISAGRNTQITGASEINSEGGVAVHSDIISSINSASQINTKNATLSVHSNNLTFLKDSQLSSDRDIYIGETKKAEEAGFHATAMEGSALNAGGDVVINSDNLTNVYSNTSVNAKNIYISSKDKVAIDKVKAINASGFAQVTSNGSIDIKDLKEINGGGNVKANDSLYIESNKINIENSILDANNGVSINSLNGNLDISNASLISNEGAVAALSQKGEVNTKSIVTNSNSLIIAADKGVELSKSVILTDAASISSNKDFSIDETTIHAQWESKKDEAGDIDLSSVGNINIAKSNINGQKNISIQSKGHLTFTESEIQAANSLELNNGRIYSNTQLKKKDNGSYYNEYGTKNKQNKLTAGDALVLNSTSSQYLTNTDLKGSAVLSNAKAGHALSNNLKITATGASKTLAGDINGDVQIVNKDKINLNANHTIDAKKDFIAQAAKGITINNSNIKSDTIQLQTTVKNTAKNSEGISNTYGDGDINISNITLTQTGKTDNSLFVDAANHLNLTNTKTTSAGSTTLKSGDLMLVNNSQLNAGKDLIIDSANQIAFNGNRKAGTNASLEYIASGKTTLTAGEVVSINSRDTQVYKNTNVSGGAVLINSGSNIGLNSNVSFNAQGSSALANNNTKLANNPSIAKKTLNGDLFVSSKNDLTIDPKVVTLVSNGDMSLTSTAGKLHLKGYAGNSGLGSETVVKLNTKGDINLAGKEVLIEGSDLSVGNKTNITATDGSVEVKGVKNSFSNEVSQHKLRTLKEQINAAKQELEKPFLDTKWLEEFQKEQKNWINYVASTCYNSPYPGGVGQCVSIRAPNMAVAEKQMPSYYKLTKSTNYNKYMAYLSNQKGLEKTISDLTQIETASNTPSTGYEHKASDIVSGKDINISAKQGVLIEGADISSKQSSINILAQGNLPSTSINDDNGTKIYKDSMRITGLADIYQQGDINKGAVTGPNYSYHQLITQPKLTAKGDIKIAGVGSLPKSTGTAINNSVVLNSADITSTNGNVRIDAANGDINLEASQVAFLDGSQTKKTSRKWYGKKKVKITTTTSNNSNAITTDISANNIKLTSDGDINIYGSELTAATNGNISISAGKQLNLYAVDNIDESTVDVKKKSSWLGIRYNKDHNNDTRQELSQLPTTLIGGKAYTKSGGSTLLQGTVFETLNPSDIQIGVGRYADDSAKLILTPITNQITTTHNQQKESLVWQKTVDSGSVETTAQLPKFNQTPTITAPNGVVVQVPVEVTVNDNNQAKNRINRGQEDLGKIAIQLSKQSGFEYLADLEKRGDINWQQVELIQKNWNYKQEGLTPGAAALIALAVTIATGGADGGQTGALLTAGNAAMSTLATQATITLINNKGDINATLKQLASSATVRGMATSALTAGLTNKFNIGNNVNNAFAKKLTNGISRGITEAAVNATVNGASFEEALTNSLRASLVDVFAGEAYSKGVKDIDADDFARNLAHKLAAAGVGCVAAGAKSQDCDAGAIGAAVGEMVGDYLIKPSQEIVLDDGSVVAVLTDNEISTIHNIAKLSAGSIALLSHVDVDTAANSAQTAVENNAIWAVIPAVIWVADKAWTAYQVYQDIQALENGTKTWEQLAREKGTEYMAQAILGNVAKFGVKAVKKGSGYALKKVAQTCSFRGDMLIKTVSGYKTIDSISIGDQVLSRNEQTGDVSFQTVLNQYNNAYKQTVYIDIVDADGNKQTIVSNTIHPFFVKIDNNTPVPPSSEGHHYRGEIENAHWVDASNLKAGYKLLSENGHWQIVQNIKVTDEPLSAYNLTVNNDHTYFVTGSGTTYGVWVHNSCAVPNINHATNHGLQRIRERGFTQQKVTDIVNNYSEKGYQPGGLTVYIKKQSNRKYDVIIVNKDNKIVSAIGGTKESLPNRRAVVTMLNNNGGFSGIALD